MKFQGLQKLDWYIIRKFLTTFFVSIAVLAVVVVIFDVSEKIDDFIKKEAPLKEIIFDYYLNFIPYFMNMYSPMFVFLTVIFFTSKMTQDSEVIAILSSGISYHRFALPYLVSACFIALLSLELGQWVIPHANGTKVDFLSIWRASAPITIRLTISPWKTFPAGACAPKYRQKAPSTTP